VVELVANRPALRAAFGAALALGCCGVAHAQTDSDSVAHLVGAWSSPEQFPTQRSLERWVYGPACGDFRGWNSSGTVPQRVGDDVDFAPGPAGNGSDGAGGPVVLTGAYVAIVDPMDDGPIHDLVFSFYDVFGGWTTSTFPGAGLLASARIGGLPGGGACPTDSASTIPNFDLGQEVQVPTGPGTDVFVMVEVLVAGTTLLHPSSWIASTSAGGGSAGMPLPKGSSDSQRWGDTNDDGLITGAAGADEVNLGGPTSLRYPFFGFKGIASLTCESIDFNNDGSIFDPVDIEAFFSVFSEGPCIPATATCNDIDYNNDGSLFDPCDVDSFMLVFSEGPCTYCGE
jgi:hypothetical protein